MLDVTPLLRLYARYRNAQLRRLDPIETQRQTLLRLLQRAQDTVFGRAHDFSRLRSVADFQRAVPLADYDAWWTTWGQPRFPHLNNLGWPGLIRYHAVTSGTSTGHTKYIPISGAMLRSNIKAALDTLVHHVTARPHSRCFGGKGFLLGGSTALVEEAPGIYSGDLSGITTKTEPWWVRPWHFPGPELALLADWEEKVERLARASLEEDIRLLAGVPSWLLILLGRVRALRPGQTLYPNLELFVHGGVNFAPYRHRFAELFAGRDLDCREVYPASEGFIASADRGYGEGLRLNVDHGLFFEFVAADELDRPNPTRHWLATAETGVNYALVLSTCAGLWAYVLGDTVRLIERDPPRILVTGRSSYSLSAFGEHLIGEEIETAATAAAQAVGADLVDFSVGVEWPDAGDSRGRHIYIVEFARPVDDPADLARFARTLDRTLCERNADYREHRHADVGMAPPEVLPVPPGTFAAWMKLHGRLGGQHKVPRVIHDPEIWADLERFCRRAGGTAG